MDVQGKCDAHSMHCDHECDAHSMHCDHECDAHSSLAPARQGGDVRTRKWRQVHVHVYKARLKPRLHHSVPSC
jgi:hypothetical protein